MLIFIVSVLSTLWILGMTFVFALCKAASNADRQMEQFAYSRAREVAKTEILK
jgi:hypothetical protein